MDLEAVGRILDRSAPGILRQLGMCIVFRGVTREGVSLG